MDKENESLNAIRVKNCNFVMVYKKDEDYLKIIQMRKDWDTGTMLRGRSVILKVSDIRESALAKAILRDVIEANNE